MELNEQQQLFDPGPEAEPHEMRRAVFMSQPTTQFHSTPVKWDPDRDSPIHTGTAAAASAIDTAGGRWKKPQDVYAVQMVGGVESGISSDDAANQREAEWTGSGGYTGEVRALLPSVPYRNEAEDKGSISYVHPTTSHHLRTHEDLVADALAEGKHVPALVQEEAALAREKPPNTLDIRASFPGLQWQNKGKDPFPMTRPDPQLAPKDVEEPFNKRIQASRDLGLSTRPHEFDRNAAVARYWRKF